MDDFDRAVALNTEIRTSGPRPVTEEEVGILYGSPTFVGLPDGRGSNLVHVLDGRWLTQRTRQPTKDRDDLWVTSALAPLTTLLVHGDLPLLSGGRLRCSAFHHPAFVGPSGWLPEVPAGGLIGFRITDGAVEVAAVDTPTQPLAEQQRARDLLAAHVRRSDGWYDDGGGHNLRHTLAEAIGGALVEDHDFLREPWLPLDELLHDPGEEQHEFSWRIRSSWQEGAEDVMLRDLPMALHHELRSRAAQYGMELDQYVIAVLGHLAWRTPFAEDLAPWESWLPERADDVRPPTALRRV